tara:strand:+ start:964 stop:1308 length:345 start_codon:yes stop_codon:yes gene_type:complete
MAESTFISAGATPGNTSRTDVYTCPSNFKGIVRFINVGNANASAKTAKLEWFDSSASTHFPITGSKSIDGESFLSLTDMFLVLEAGDKVTVTAGTASTVTAIAGVELIYNPLTT